MFGQAIGGEQIRTGRPPGSRTVDCEFLNDRVRQQFGGQFGYADSCPLRAFCGLTAGDLDLETLALPDRDDFGEPEPVTSARDRLALRVMDLGPEHNVDNYLGHGKQRTADAHLTGAQERRVLSQRSRTTDDRLPASRRAA